MKFRELTIDEFTKFLNKSELKSFMQSPKMDTANTNVY